MSVFTLQFRDPELEADFRGCTFPRQMTATLVKLFVVGSSASCIAAQAGYRGITAYTQFTMWGVMLARYLVHLHKLSYDVWRYTTYGSLALWGAFVFAFRPQHPDPVKADFSYGSVCFIHSIFFVFVAMHLHLDVSLTFIDRWMQNAFLVAMVVFGMHAGCAHSDKLLFAVGGTMLGAGVGRQYESMRREAYLSEWGLRTTCSLWRNVAQANRRAPSTGHSTSDSCETDASAADD